MPMRGRMDAMTTGTVYGLYEAGSTAVRYVGQTTRPLEVRLKGHLDMTAFGNTAPVNDWIRKVMQAGGTVEVRPIRTDVPEADLREAERAAVREAVSRGERLTNSQLMGVVGSVSVTVLDMDHTVPEMALTLTALCGRKVSEGDCLRLIAKALGWAYRQVNPDALDMRAEVERASTLPSGDEAETLANVCGWPTRHAHLLLEAMCETAPAVIVREGGAYRFRDFPERYAATLRATGRDTSKRPRRAGVQ